MPLEHEMFESSRRSQNVEDMRTGQLRELLNHLTRVPLQAYEGLTQHPFMTTEQVMAQRYQDYLRANPPDYGSPLAMEAGVGQVAESGKQPMSLHAEGFAQPPTNILMRILRGEL